MTEADVQNVLAQHAFMRRWRIAIPNCSTIFGWEADFIAVTNAGLTHEFEVKVSRGDLLSELKSMAQVDGQPSSKRWKHRVISGENKNSWRKCKPNYFWLALAPGILLPKDDIPSHVGVCVVDNAVNIIRDAPRLHKDKLSQREYCAVAIGLSARYWQYRKVM